MGGRESREECGQEGWSAAFFPTTCGQAGLGAHTDIEGGGRYENPRGVVSNRKYIGGQ